MSHLSPSSLLHSTKIYDIEGKEEEKEEEDSLSLLLSTTFSLLKVDLQRYY